jgi:uncharacterized membrane protein YdjX (TVP38/TMEM64 family)
MSGFLIAFLLALGGGTWIYTKLMRSSGGLTKEAVTAAAVAGVLIFIIVLYALTFVAD